MVWDWSEIRDNNWRVSRVIQEIIVSHASPKPNQQESHNTQSKNRERILHLLTMDEETMIDRPTQEERDTHYKPGSIKRVKLKNFLTYDAVEFFPGPRWVSYSFEDGPCEAYMSRCLSRRGVCVLAALINIASLDRRGQVVFVSCIGGVLSRVGCSPGSG